MPFIGLKTEIPRWWPGLLCIACTFGFVCLIVCLCRCPLCAEAGGSVQGKQDSEACNLDLSSLPAHTAALPVGSSVLKGTQRSGPLFERAWPAFQSRYCSHLPTSKFYRASIIAKRDNMETYCKVSRGYSGDYCRMSTRAVDRLTFVGAYLT